METIKSRKEERKDTNILAASRWLLHPQRREVRTYVPVRLGREYICFLSIGNKDSIIHNAEQLYRYVSLQKDRIIEFSGCVNIQALFHNCLDKPR